MANNGGYQPTWVGALPANQSQPAPQMMQSPPTMGEPVVGGGQAQPQTITNQISQMPVQQWPTPMMQPWPMPMTDSQLFIANVPSDEAVNNYPVGRGVTAFLVNYNAGVFWTKRQTDDGLGYKTVKHYFHTDEQTSDINRRSQNGSMVSEEDFALLNEKVAKLQREFEEFIK